MSDTSTTDAANWLGPQTRIFFHGCLHPRAGQWYFNEPIILDYEGFTWELHIRNADFKVTVAGVPQGLDPELLVSRVRGFVSAAADALGYHLGAAITAEVVSGNAVNTATGAMVIIDMVPRWTALEGADSQVPISGEQLDPYVNAALGNLYLRSALADLRSAIEDADSTAFFAHRAVESVRHWICERDGEQTEGSAAWSYLRSVFQLDEAELRRLSDGSKAPRHGKAVEITVEERLTALNLARQIVAKAVAKYATKV